MGKQGSRSIVTKAEDLYKRFPEKFSQDFDANKRSLDGLKIFQTKIQRNIAAGHITKLAKTKKEA
jgi:ribosomal protein S17E